MIECLIFLCLHAGSPHYSCDVCVLQKIVFKDQIEKLMAEAEKYKTIADDYSLLHQKYEAAKHKMAQAFTDLGDVTTAKEDYYQQVITTNC